MRGRGSLGREKADPVCRVSEATSKTGSLYWAASARRRSLTPPCRHHQSRPITSQRLITLQRTDEQRHSMRFCLGSRTTSGQTGQKGSLERSRDSGAEDISEPDVPPESNKQQRTPTEHTPNNEPKIIPCEKTETDSQYLCKT